MSETTYKKMNPEWKARWVEALRSGRYQQGQGALRERDCFCCLGVLCDLAAPAKWEGPKVDGMRSFCGLAADPPAWVRRDTGLDAFASERLQVLNDNDDWTFPQIADWIEANL